MILISQFNRDAIGRCDSCTALPNCGFCVSTLKCIDGLESGPTDGSPCPAWSFGGSDCPGKFSLTANIYLVQS